MSQVQVAPTPELGSVTWAQVRDLVRARVGDQNFSAWIAPLGWTWSEGGLVLEAPDRLTRDRVARHFRDAITQALVALGHACPVRLEVQAPLPVLPIRCTPPDHAHTFDTFVVGESNRRAWATAQELLAGPPRAPLFLHGTSGLGKTHILHATFHALDARGIDVACLAAAELLAALLAAYGGRGPEAFWHDLWPLGALLLDDVHSLAGQEEVQERLMEGLVAWVDGGRLLMLTSDRAPGAMPTLAARVRDRFEGGAVVPIEPPEPALRLAILERKASALGLVLETPLAARLAVAVGGNVRRLEGALLRLLAYARTYGRRVDEALAVEALPELRAEPSAPLTFDRILEETAAAFGSVARALRARGRRRDLVLPRQVAMYLARKLLARPFAEVAAAFARDHTTVLHACRVVAARLGGDRTLAVIVERIEQRLKADPQ